MKQLLTSNSSAISIVKKHYYDYPTFQKTFYTKILKLVTAMESIFNSFASDSSTVRSLRNGLEITRSEDIEKSICSLKKLGDDQYRKYVKDMFRKPESGRKPLSDTIQINNKIK